MTWYRSVPPPRRSRAARTAVGIAVLLGVAALAWLWNGPPYRAADPDRVAVRLKAEAGQAYDEAALPGRPEMGPARVETSGCSYRGLRGLAHIDESRLDVRRFGLDWRATGIPEVAARRGQERTRARLEREGWTAVGTGDDERGFRFRRPTGEGGDEDILDVRWYHETGTYSVSVYAGCGKLPDGFDEHDWPEGEWDPWVPATPPAPRPATPR